MTTAIADAMKRTGLNVIDANQARRVAYEALRRNRHQPTLALAPFLKILSESPELRAQVALFYLQDAARDMDGPAGSAAARAAARKAASEIEAVHESHQRHGRPPSDPPAGGDEPSDPRRAASGRVAAKPNPPRGIEAMKLSNIVVDAVLAMDAYQTSYGPIGSLLYKSLPRLARDSAHKASDLHHQARLFNLMAKYAVVDDSRLQCRDVIPDDEFRRMVQQAAELADA